MKTIGSAQVIPGEKTEGYIQLSSDTDGTPFQIPVLVANGKEEGPTIWVHGCIHGEEYGGAASIIRYFQGLDISKLKGTFVGIPVMNIPSFKARSRNSPLDGTNLNRLFPGDPKGTYSQRLAYEMLATIEETADYVIDFHSGGIGAQVPYYMIVIDDETDASQKSVWLAERMGSDVIWRSKDENVLDNTITAHVMGKDIPTVTVECGGGNVTELHENQFKESIQYAMMALNMIPGEAPVQKQYTVINHGTFIFTGNGGLFVPSCNVGDMLNKGDLIGSIMNLYGKVTEEFYCPTDRAYIAAIGHRYWPTEPGQLIAEAIKVESGGKE